MKNNLLKSSLFIFITMLIVSCSSPQEPDFKTMQNVKFKTATLKGDLIITADAIFTNPNSIGIDVGGLDLEVFANGSKIANLNQNVTAEMKGNSDFTLPIDVSIPLKTVFRDIKGGLLKNIVKGRKADIKMEGNITIDYKGMQREIPFEYEETYKPSF